MTFSIEAASRLPQYCAAIIPAPAAIPVIKRFRTNCTCPASETADSEVWSIHPSMIASVALTRASIKF